MDILEIFAPPFAEVQASCGTLYLYSPSDKAQKRHRELQGADLETRARETVRLIASTKLRQRIGDEALRHCVPRGKGQTKVDREARLTADSARQEG